jgi:hypothetical protein
MNELVYKLHKSLLDFSDISYIHVCKSYKTSFADSDETHSFEIKVNLHKWTLNVITWPNVPEIRYLTL